MLSADDIKRLLDLKPLPMEGGYYRQTYRSRDVISAGALPERYRRDKVFSTAIYYLLEAGTCSRLHRLPSEEVFHFLLGEPVQMLQLRPDGSSETILIGPDIAAGQRPQVIVPGGVWQGSRVVEGGRFALMGVTVAPGFDFEDYQPGQRDELLARYPDRRDLIVQLTPPPGAG